MEFNIIKIFLKSEGKIIHNDYAKKLHGFMMKNLGNNEYGKTTHDYYYSLINDIESVGDGFKIIDGKSYIILKFKDINLLMALNRCFQDEMFDGIKFFNFEFVNYNIEKNRFKTLISSPIRIMDKKFSSEWFSEEELHECEKYMIENIRQRSKEVGFQIDENLKIKIIGQHVPNAIHYKDGNNVLHFNCRIFDLEIDTNKDTKEFIYFHGIGKSTGIGLGHIY